MRTRWPFKRLTSFRANYRRRRNGNVRARNVKNDSTSDQVGPLTEVFHFFNFFYFFLKKKPTGDSVKMAPGRTEPLRLTRGKLFRNNGILLEVQP